METTQDPAPTFRCEPQPVTVAPASLPLVPGYEVLSLVGRGGMGRVYRAKHLTLGRVVALKLLSHEPDDHSLARFREEVRAVAQLQHPNIAQLFETGVTEGQPFFTQEFLDGGSLAQSFARKPQDSTTAARIAETIARAIQHSHEHGILHRDLKPANILLASDGTPKVTDFGLAKTFTTTVGDPSETAPDTSGLTRTGEILGTPAYMPPEQASGVLSLLGPPADVYGIGAILYEALTGRPPFLGPDAFRTVLMVREMEPVSPRVLQPDVPRDLETICLKCLAKEPHRRYATAGALADDLRRFLNREPILARPVGRWERLVKWARRRPWQAAAAALAMAMVAGLVVGFALLADKNQQIEKTNSQLSRALQGEEQANVDLRAEKEKVEAEKSRAERTLGLTLYALDRYFFAFSDQLKEIPRTETLRLKVLSNARGTLDGLNKFQPDSRELQRYRMEGYDRLGNIEAQLGNLKTAEADYTKAREIATVLVERFPEEVGFKRDRLLAIVKLAGLRARQGDAKGADAMVDSIMPAYRALVAADPNSTGVMELEVVVRQDLLNRELRQGHWDNAEAEMRALGKLNRRLAEIDKENPARALEVIDGERLLASFLLDLGKLDDAALVLNGILRELAVLPSSDSLRARKLRAVTAATVGDYFQRRKLPSLAYLTFTAALQDYQSLSADFPESPLYRYQRAETLWYMAVSASALGDMSVLRQCLEKSDALLTELIRAHPNDTSYRSLAALVTKNLGNFKPKR